MHFFLPLYVILVLALTIACVSGQRPFKVSAFLNVKDTIHHISGFLGLCFMVHDTKFPNSLIFELFYFILPKICLNYRKESRICLCVSSMGDD